MKSSRTILIFLFSFIVGYTLTYHNFIKSNSKIIEQNDRLLSIKLAFVGDLMCHTPQIKSARTDDGNYNFEPAFEFMKDYLSSADFTAGNLETTIGDSNDTFTGYPRFRSPIEYLIALKNAGFDFLFTANNHSLDYGETGILKSINLLKRVGIDYTGTFENYIDFDSLRVIEINGFKLCLIAASYGTNGINIPKGKDYLINLIDLDSLRNQIKRAKGQNVDLIIINLHFGDEYSTKPNHYQKRIVDSLIAFGADIIVGNHPHVLQPIEIKKSFNSKIDSIVVAYSLGNFISNQRKLETASGVILFIELEKNSISQIIRLKKVELLPTYVFKGRIDNFLEYKILPLFKSEIYSDSSSFPFVDKRELKRSYESSTRILLEYLSRSDILKIH